MPTASRIQEPRRRLWTVGWAMAIAGLGANALDLTGVTPGALWNPGVVDLTFLTFALLGAYALFVANERDPRIRLGVLLGGVAIGGIGWAASGAPIDRALTFGTRGIGLVSLGALIWGWQDRRDARASWRLAVAVLLPAFVWFSQAYLHLTVVVSPRILDAAIYSTDATYGVSPSFAMAQLFYAAPALALAAAYAYSALPFFIALVFALRQRSRTSGESDLLVAFLTTAAGGFLFYLLIPVVGPGPAYQDAFPFDPPPLSNVSPTGGSNVIRNCVPSLHTAWALLVLWHARPLATPWKIAVATFFVLNELATLGFGFHYLYDLVLAVPFTLAIQAFAMNDAPREARLRGAAVGALLTATWVALAFTARPLLASHVAVPWLATLATIAVSWRLESRLWEQSEA